MIRQLYLIFLIFSISLSAQERTTSTGFTENKGQIIDQKEKPNPAVKYLLNANGLNVQLKKNGFSYDVFEMKKIPLTTKDRNLYASMNSKDGSKNNSIMDYSLQHIVHRVDIDFENSSKNVELIPSEKSTDYDNYYTIKHAPEGILMVHKFQKVLYKNLYPKIDVVFFIPEDSTKVVEYNFIIHPGGKISGIKMRFNGVKTDLDDSKIKMKTRFGVMEETLPLSWAEEGLAREDIVVNYKKIEKNVYGFDFDESQVSGKTIVIDPVPVRLWGTYYGNENGVSSCMNLITDVSNNIYISGSTTSTANVATAGTHLSVYDANQNCYFAKINSDGVRIWGTYYSVQDTAMIIDHNFNLIIVGSLFYDEFNVASANSYQPIKNNLKEMYIIKLNSAGVREWGTYYGGSANDDAHSVAVDSANNIYVGGESSSITSTLTTPDSFQPSSTSTSDLPIGIIVKFSPFGDRIWATFYGGRVYSINISDDNFIYISGAVFDDQNSNIATPGAYQENPAGTVDSFISKFTLSGQRIWGTFLGISGYDVIYQTRLLGNNLYILGNTYAQTGVATPNTFYPTYAALLAAYTYWTGLSPTFIMKFDISTQEKIWCSYFFQQLTSIDVNDVGEVFVAGFGNIADGIATPDGFMPEKGIYLKGYFIKLNNTGQRVWGSYIGGNSAAHFIKLKLDSAADIYVSGTTFGGTDGIATNIGMISPTNELGNYSAFLVKFRDCLSSVFVSSNSPVCIGETIQLTASGGTTYSWTGPNGFNSTLASPEIPTASVLNNGEYFCTIIGTGDCDDTKSVVVLVGDNVAPVLNVATLPTLTGDCNSLTIPVPTATDACAGIINATTNSALVFPEAGTYTIVWNYTAGTNVSTQNQTVVITPQPLPTASSPQFFCKQENATLNDFVITGQEVKWYDALINGNLVPNTSSLVNGITYYVSQTINGCESLRIPVVATIYETVAPAGNAIQTFCDSQILTLADFIITGTSILFYDSAVEGNLLPTTTTLVNNTTYYASQTLNGCESISRLALMPNIISGVPANGYNEMMCDNLGDGFEVVNLSDYNANLITNAASYTFKYYTNFTAAENETIGSEITNFSNYALSIGLNSIYVRVMFANSCFEVVNLELSLMGLPNLKMKDKYAVCENGFVTLTADAGFDSYIWSTGAVTQMITVTQGGNYSVSVSKNHGTITCTSTKNVTVEVSEKATITAIETIDWTSNNNIITIIVNGSGNYEYSIDGINFQNSNQFYELPNGEYTVYVNDINGCGIAKRDVYLLMYPKFFTPNSDGYNDSWGIQFYKNEINLVVKIFDRYGKLIKQLTAKDPVWDGTYNGSNLPATDYWFTVIRQDGTEYKGHFTLKR